MNWASYKTWLGNQLIANLPEMEKCPRFDQLVTDSREIKKGDWFLPLKGESFDGHSFIEEALKRGAVGYFSNQGKLSNSKTACVLVRNTMQTYHAIASGWRSSLPGTFQLVALTGSVGKTTAKTMTSLMLSHIAKTFSTPGNQNTEFSIPKAILEIDETYRYGVLEFGARHQGDIKFLTETAKPNVSVCLNVGSAHLEIFKSRENILKTKLEIISEAPLNSIGVILRDDPILFEKALTLGKQLVSFGYHSQADICIKSESKFDEKMDLIFHIKGEDYRLILPLYHSSYALNSAAALAVGFALKIPISKCIEGLREFTGVKGRYRLLKTVRGQTVIDDAYNANPESMKAGLSSVLHSFYDKDKILILGDMRELGAFSEEAHRSLAEYCIKLNPKRLITVGSLTKFLDDELSQLGMDSRSIHHFSSAEDLLKEVHALTKDANLIYIKGSFAIQLGKVVDELIKPLN